MTKRMHLLIIGAGPGGYETAAEAVKRGLDVTLVTDGPLGGTCLNEGCIPTKTLIHNCCELSGDLPSALARKAAVISQLRAGIESLLKNVDIIYGKASFIDAHTVKVNDRKISADKTIICTGSVSSSLPVPGAGLAVDSSSILEIDTVPERLAIIGGGVIGLEFAGIFNSLGSRVTVIEYCTNILPRLDSDLAKRLRQQMSRSGVSFILGAAVTAIGNDGQNGLTVSYNQKDEECHIVADKVLMAVGRRPNIDSLNLDDISVEYDREGIKVDSSMRTSVPDIYAVGDVTGGYMLAHVASAQGMRALNDITGVEDSINFDCVPAVVFTNPEFASVGLSEDECRTRGIEYSVHKSFYRANGKAVSSGDTEGLCKILCDCRGKIVGCHILGASASTIIGEAAVLVSLGAELDKAKWIIHAHPTLSEVLMNALRS